MKVRVLKALKKIDVTRRVSDHLMGEQHSLGHRLVVGSVVIMAGVVIAGCGHIQGLHWTFAYLIDATGYLIHGVGAVPYIEWFITLRDDNVQEESEDEDSSFLEDDNNLFGNREN